MAPEDTRLYTWMREWLESQPVGLAHLTERAATKGEAAVFVMTPTRPGADAVTMWVGDEPDHLSAALGPHAWWDWRPLTPEFVATFCRAASSGNSVEQTRTIGRYKVAHKIKLLLDDQAPLGWAQFSPFLWGPFPKWQSKHGVPWTERGVSSNNRLERQRHE